MKMISDLATMALLAALVVGTAAAWKTAGEINPPVHAEEIVELAEINPPVLIGKGGNVVVGEINPPVWSLPLSA